ncbi:MAG: GntR family transcriptional regulator [Acidimicrobiales bacterium]
MLRQPKYLRIYEDLAARILAGEYRPAALLPSQRELSNQYGVTLMTLRQALQMLQDEGLIDARPGTGTFVAAPRYAYDLGHLRSFAQDMAFQGALVETQVISARTLVAPPPVAARLGLPKHGRAYAIRRVRLIDNRPVVLQDSYLPPRLGRMLGTRELEDRSLYAVLAEAGVSVNRATETICPAALDSDDAKLLHRDPGATALLSHHVSFDAEDTPVIDDLALLPGDSVVITANRDSEGVRLSYALTAAHQVTSPAPRAEQGEHHDNTRHGNDQPASRAEQGEHHDNTRHG